MGYGLPGYNIRKKARIMDRLPIMRAQESSLLRLLTRQRFLFLLLLILLRLLALLCLRDMLLLLLLLLL